MADLSIVNEMKDHVGGLTWLTGFLGMIIGVLLMAAYNYFKGRLVHIENRQEEFREKVLPGLVTKDDLKSVLETFEKVGNVFITRVESFMTACHSGECSMAVLVKTIIARFDQMPSDIPQFPKRPLRKEGP